MVYRNGSYSLANSSIFIFTNFKQELEDVLWHEII